jgi:hypothetical protein
LTVEQVFEPDLNFMSKPPFKVEGLNQQIGPAFRTSKVLLRPKANN